MKTVIPKEATVRMVACVTGRLTNSSRPAEGEHCAEVNGKTARVIGGEARVQWRQRPKRMLMLTSSGVIESLALAVILRELELATNPTLTLKNSDESFSTQIENLNLVVHLEFGGIVKPFPKLASKEGQAISDSGADLGKVELFSQGSELQCFAEPGVCESILSAMTAGHRVSMVVSPSNGQ